MSPYWRLHQHGFAISEDAGFKYLLPTAKEEPVGINSVSDGTTDERHPMKHKWRFIGVLNEQLAKHIEYNGNNKERQETSSDDNAGRFIRQ